MRRARRPLERKARKKLVFFLGMICLCGVGGLVLILWWSNLSGGVDRWLKKTDLLLLKEIVVVGNQRSPREEIIQALDLAPRQLIFTFSLSRLEEKIGRLPFVEEARLRRRWPDRLEIEVREKQPMAMLYLDELYLLDKHCRPIAPAPTGENFDLPLVTGISPREWRQRPAVWSRLLKRSAELLALWREEGKDWSEKPAQIVLDEVCGVTVVTSGRIWEIQLGMENLVSRLRAWRRVLKVLGQRAGGVSYFDCAANGSVVVGLANGEENLTSMRNHGQK